MAASRSDIGHPPVGKLVRATQKVYFSGLTNPTNACSHVTFCDPIWRTHKSEHESSATDTDAPDRLENTYLRPCGMGRGTPS